MKSGKEHVALITGSLAEPSVRAVADQLAQRLGLRAEVIVLNIQVAALMTPGWVEKKLVLPDEGPSRVDRVILPGYCRGDLAPIARKLGVSVERGPRDVHDLPLMFDEGQHASIRPDDYGRHSIEIIAEINDAAHLSAQRVIGEAQALAAAGADVIDIGCDPHVDRPPWRGVDQIVRELRDRAMRVSVDSFHPQEVALACAAGAELVLSVNSSNCAAAGDWGAEVVVVPDDPHDLDGLDNTVAELEKRGVRFRIDPVIEPIGFGFAQSLGRYLETRRRYPQAPMMMGIGNLTEMTGVDSAGVNMLLAGFCQELAIDSVLTTQVINWARSSVLEIDIARKIMHYAVTHHTVPKHVDEKLIVLRDARLREVEPKVLDNLARRLTDDNVRIYADTRRRRIHAMNRRTHASGDDPYAVFDELDVDDPSHAFYLGYEMAKAMTAITLGKNYTQDESLDWGFLTKDEASHYQRRKRKKGRERPQ